MTLAVGEVLHGHCGGYFGGLPVCKRIEALGVDWVVARSVNPYDNEPRFAYGNTIHETLEQFKDVASANCQCID